LISPIIDLTDTVGPKLRYARWFACDDDLPPAQDFLEVEISDDDGASWHLIENVPHDASWVEQEVTISDYVSLTDQVRVRVNAVDNPNNSKTEVGIDAVSLYDLACFESGDGDIDGDGDVDFVDLDLFVGVLVGTNTDPAHIARSDLNGSGVPDGIDIQLFVNAIAGA